MQAKKSLGQNFLRDKGILKKIADFAQIQKEDTVVEVGPGEGTLTEFILERANKVIAIEKDEKMVEFLKEKFKKEIKEGKLEVVESDILELNLQNIFSPQAHKCTDIFLLENSSCSAQSASQGISELADSKNFVLVGNIPYYITGALFKKVLESENKPKSITFVVQKEVAERIVAKDSKESILSISIKAYGEPYFGGVIKAGSFSPKPKVDSAIIAVRNIGIEKLKDLNIKIFFEILKRGFAHKRKLLIKNLGFKKGIFEKCGIPEKERAENLKVEDWICLAKEMA